MHLEQGTRSETGFTKVVLEDLDEARVFMRAYPTPHDKFSSYKGWQLGRLVRKMAKGDTDTVELYVRDQSLALAGKELRIIHADNIPALYGHGHSETAEASSERGAKIAHKIGHEIGDYLERA
ncbi:hypothetical protein KC973_01180, partial [Candidatus Saccharibacteria bacterium]|nr:hypothetical protein [Candidatus Saccharibacteria bacterium]